METYGFIITRHVNSAKTNRYWNHCVRCIRNLYPFKKIVIIDDNSNKDYLKSDFEYQNVVIVESQFKKRGELLPYYYFLKDKYFENAVIMHDSVFFHKRLNFEKLVGMNVIPFWHFPADKENAMISVNITSQLTNSFSIQSKLTYQDTVLGLPQNNQNNWNGCFGCQCFISLKFLTYLENKYHITNMVELVKCRRDRCCLERIFGVLFYTENMAELRNTKSILGRIHNHYAAFSYTFDKYMNDISKDIIPQHVVKVWTGR